MQTETTQSHRYATIIRRYEAAFGELPPRLYEAGEGVEVYLELMEEALAGKRGKITLHDLGYLPGSQY